MARLSYPPSWRENLSAELAATQERLIVPRSFEDTSLVLSLLFSLCAGGVCLQGWLQNAYIMAGDK
jgi:hypothetical protein